MTYHKIAAVFSEHTDDVTCMVPKKKSLVFWWLDSSAGGLGVVLKHGPDFSILIDFG